MTVGTTTVWVKTNGHVVVAVLAPSRAVTWAVRGANSSVGSMSNETWVALIERRRLRLTVEQHFGGGGEQGAVDGDRQRRGTAFGGRWNERAAHGENRRGGPDELTGALCGGRAVLDGDGRGLGDGAGGVERQFGGRDERRRLRHVVEIGDAGAGEVLPEHPDGHRGADDLGIGNGRAGHRQHVWIGRWRGAPANPVRWIGRHRDGVVGYAGTATSSDVGHQLALTSIRQEWRWRRRAFQRSPERFPLA